MARNPATPHQAGSWSPQEVGDGLSENEIAARRDDAVRRALNTPPKPHKGPRSGDAKPAAGKGRTRPGKAR